MKKITMALALLLVFTVILTACGTGDSEAAGDGDVREVTMIINASHGDHSVNNNTDLWPGFYCNFIQVAENDIDSRILLEMVGGARSFDIAYTQASGARQYGAMGLLEPLAPLPDQDDVFPALVEQYSIGDDLFGYSMIGDFFLLYYNTEHFEEAGLTDPPTTFDEVLTYALRLTKDRDGVRADEPGFDPNNVVQWGWQFMGGTGHGNPWFLTLYLYANGTQFIYNDFENMTYEVTVTSPEFRASLQYIYDMYYVHHAMPSGFINYDYDEFGEMFVSGQVSMALNWPYMWAMSQDRPETAGKISVAALPAGTSGSGGGPQGGWSIGVFRDAPNKDDALEFAKIFAGREAQEAFVEVMGGNILTRFSFFDQKIAESANDPDELNFWNMILQNSQVSRPTCIAQTGAAAADTQTIAARYINMILSNQIDMVEGLERMREELETALYDSGYMQ